MRLEDLPRDIQRQVLAKAGESVGVARTSQRVARGRGLPIRCAECLEPHKSGAAAERHSKATGHARTECVLEEA